MASILFVSHSADRTGPPMYLLGLQRWLRAEAGVEVATALQRGGELRPAFAELGPVFDLHGDEPGDAPVLDASAYDLVYLNASWTVRSLPALAGPRAVVAHVHEMDDVIRFQLPAADRRALLERPDLLLVGARSARRNLEAHGVDAPRIATVPYFLPHEPALGRAAPEPAVARARLGLPDRPLVLGGGVVDWRKAPDLLLHVAWHLRRRAVDVGVAWVGDRNERPTWCDWDEEAARLGLADRAVHLAATPDLAGVLAAADVFVLSSREDTFPLVCLEAAALGVPLVCFDDAGVVELIEDDGSGVAGAAVPYPDLDAMAGAVADLLADPARRAAVGAQLQDRYEARHRVAAVGPQLLAALDPWLGGA